MNRVAGGLVLLPAAGPGRAGTYHVAPTGRDAADRDGTTPAAAWASLAYACDRVPAGPHPIRLAAGVYTATRTAAPNSGVTIRGAGPAATRVVRPPTGR